MNTPSRKTASAYVCPISLAEFPFDPGAKQSRTDASHAQLAHTAAIATAQNSVDGVYLERDLTVAERRTLWVEAQ